MLYVQCCETDDDDDDLLWSGSEQDGRKTKALIVRMDRVTLIGKDR